MDRLRSHKRLFAFIVGLLLLLLIGRFLPVGAWLESGSRRLESAGVVGAMLFVSAYTLGALLFVPAAMFSVVAGYTYGPWWGAIVAVPGVASSSFAMFMLARTLLRRTIEDWLGRDPRFLAVDRLLGVFGVRAVVLLRFSPISPFSVLNHAFGLTSISKRQYLLATCIGAVPGSLFYSQLGAAAPHLRDIAAGRMPQGGGAQTAFLLVGLVATAAVGLWLGKLAKDTLASAPREEGVPVEPEPAD